ncbi:MAG: macro domain-containing protein [Candidatus Aminicenantes bacterium]|nr:MAG: macro domain-containing protein [Candidatus Aminicenantes bacterium]
MKEWEVNEKKLKLEEGNLVLLDVEAVVNAANKNLILGGGVAGAIRQFGGPSIQEECNKIGPISVGEAVITGAGDLKAKYVIHAAGPVFGEGDEEAKLTNATLNSLKIVNEKKLESVAFPAISTGIFRFPLKRCSEIMIKVSMDFLKTEENEYPKEIILCLYGQEAYSVFQGTLEELVD